MKARYINPYTDFGFKKLFGEEANKELLKDFLNEFLPEPHRIDKLSFRNPELLGTSPEERKAIFDIYCENENGAQFIVEMQKAKLKFFKDRSVFYTSFPIAQQAEKGDWDFRLKPVYCVAILDFTFDEEREKKGYFSMVQLKDQYCQIFYNKLAYIFIEMPRFKKEENELQNHFEKWLYFLKNLEDFDQIPDILNEEIFIKGFEVAEIANFDEKQRAQYEASLRVYRDLNAVLDTSFDEGIQKGMEIGEKKGIEIGKQEGIEIGEKKKAREMAKILKARRIDPAFIAESSGLTLEEIEKL